MFFSQSLNSLCYVLQINQIKERGSYYSIHQHKEEKRKQKLPFL